MSERITNTAQTCRAGSSRDQSDAGSPIHQADEPLSGGEVSSMVTSHCDSLKAEMLTYVEHELRALRLQQSEDVTRFYNLTKGLMKKIENLEAKPNSVREEVEPLRNDANDVLETRTELAQEIDTRFFRVGNRLGKLNN